MQISNEEATATLIRLADAELTELELQTKGEGDEVKMYVSLFMAEMNHELNKAESKLAVADDELSLKMFRAVKQIRAYKESLF